MRRIVLVILLLLSCAPEEGYAQKFRATYDAHMRTRKYRQESCGNQNRVNIVTTARSGVISENTNFTDHIGSSIDNGRWWEPSARSYIFEGVNPITKVQINGFHWDDPTWTKCKQRGSGSNSASISASDYPCVNKHITGFFGGYDDGSYLNVKIEPVNGGTPLIFEGGGDGFFPTDDQISISSKQPCDNYIWEYSIDGGNFTPSSKFNATERFTLSANELLGSNILHLLNKNIRFRARYTCNNAYTEEISMPIILSAPHIISVNPVMETCHNSRDGKIEINLDRAIYNKESLRIAYKDPENGDYVIREGDSLKMDDSGKKIILEKLGDGKYDFRIYGNYKYGDNSQDTISLYTDGDKHRDTITIASRPKVTYTKKTYAVSCYAGSDGRIGVLAKGGVGKYVADVIKENDTYSQTITLDENVEGFFTELKAGKYKITLRDTNHCYPQFPDSVEQKITVLQPAKPLEIVNIKSEEAKGFGRSDGEAWAYIVDGTKNYTAVWKDSLGNTLPSEPLDILADGRVFTKVKNLKKGKYYLYAYDNNYDASSPNLEVNMCGCMAVDSIAVDQPPKLVVKIEESRYITCFGDNDGELTAHVSGGRPHSTPNSGDLPYTYEWKKVGGATTPIGSDSVVSGLDKGDYIVNITDRNGITTSETVFLDHPKELSATVRVIRHNDCAGDNTGSLEVIASGGTAPYTYEWRMINSDTTKIVSGLSKGVYEVEVRDSRFTGSKLDHHCLFVVSGTITDPDYIEMDTLYQTTVSCAGGKDGKIHIKAKGGRTGIFTAYLHQGANKLDSVNFLQDEIATFTELSKGNYEISIKDSNDCSLTIGEQPDVARITVTEPTPVEVLKTTAVEPLGFGLSNGSAQVAFKGGTAPYTVVWIDEDGNNIVPLALTTIGDSIVSKVENIRSATYQVTIKDANYSTATPQNELNTCGCTDTISFFVPEPPLLEVAIEEFRYITCFGDSDGQIVAHTIGGRPHLTGDLPYDYQWYKIDGGTLVPRGGNDSIASGLETGYYKVIVTDRNGITAESDALFLDQPPVLGAITNVINNNDCAGDSAGSMEVIPSGGVAPYTYEWSTGDTTRVIRGLPKGRYSVTVRDSRFSGTLSDHHCFVLTSDTITAPDYMEIDSLTQSPVSCFGGKDGKIHLKASGGIVGVYTVFLSLRGNIIDSLTFNQGEVAIFTDLAQGKYDFYLNDSNDCQLTTGGLPFLASITVTEPTPVTVLSKNSVEPLGFGLSNGSARVIFKGGIAPYSVVWVDEDGNNIPALPLQTVGDSIISRVENIKSSTYYVTIKDNNYSSATPQNELNTCGCTDTISLFVPQPPPLEVDVEELRYVTCYGDMDGAIVAHGQGGRPFLVGRPYKYQWYKIDGAQMNPVWGSDSIAHELYSGHYKVEITDRNGITKLSESFHLVEPEQLVVTTTVHQNTICSGDSIGIIEAFVTGGTPPYSYIWSTNDTTKIVSGLPQGYYVVGVRDARHQENILGHYCVAQVYDSIISPNSIRINRQIKHPTCVEDSDGELKVQISGGVPPYSYAWDDITEQTLTRSNLKGGSYKITVHDSGGCFWSETFEVIQPEAIVLDLGNDFTLCKDQKVTINGQHIRGDLSYTWTDEVGKVLSTDPYYDVDRAGTYRLLVQSPEGCQGTDEVIVSQISAEVTTDFVMATKAANNTPVFAVNITRTEIDSLMWIVPEAVSVLDETNDQIQLSFPENGEFIVGMIAYKDACEDILYKPILIVDEWDIEEEQQNEQGPFIKYFYVTPNPNNGYFTAEVELREATNYSLTLLNFEGMLMDEKKIMNKQKESTVFEKRGLSQGLYFLIFKSKEATSVFKVIIR